jgi:hypothetical protein
MSPLLETLFGKLYSDVGRPLIVPELLAGANLAGRGSANSIPPHRPI